MELSICIPTYNRAELLRNCLESIIACQVPKNFQYEVCVSDNCSTDETRDVVKSAKAHLPLRYHRNRANVGISRNFLNVVDMARGRFVWLIGDDDLILPHALRRLRDLFNEFPGVDFYFVNSFHLHADYVLSFEQPFRTSNLPKDMRRFSLWEQEREVPFFDLIDPKISFDFLGGMYLSVFRRDNWLKNASAVTNKAMADNRCFSHFDNTFPHIKIFSKAFSESKAYSNPDPLSVCLTGVREWAPMYPFVRSVRLVEALDEYRKNGLSLLRYLKCKNFALRTFLPDLGYMILNRRQSGLEYLNGAKVLRECWYFPNLYLSALYYIGRKLKSALKRAPNRVDSVKEA